MQDEPPLSFSDASVASDATNPAFATTVTVNANVVMAAYAQAFFDNFSYFDTPPHMSHEALSHQMSYSAASTGEAGDATPSWTYATHYLHTITQEGGSWVDEGSCSSSDITLQSAMVTNQLRPSTKQHSMTPRSVMASHAEETPFQISGIPGISHTLACWHEIQGLLSKSPTQSLLSSHPSKRSNLSPTQSLHSPRHPRNLDLSPTQSHLTHPSNRSCSPTNHPKGQYCEAEAPPLIEDSDEEFSTDSCDGVPEDQHDDFDEKYDEWPPPDDMIASQSEFYCPSGLSGYSPCKLTNLPHSLPKELPSKTHKPACVDSQRRWRSLPNRHHPRYGSTRHNSEVPITFPWPYDVVIDTQENARMNAGESVAVDDSMFMLADLNNASGLNAGAFCKYMCPISPSSHTTCPTAHPTYEKSKQSRILSDVTIHIIPDEVVLPHLRAIRELYSHTR